MRIARLGQAIASSSSKRRTPLVCCSSSSRVFKGLRA